MSAIVCTASRDVFVLDPGPESGALTLSRDLRRTLVNEGGEAERFPELTFGVAESAHPAVPAEVTSLAWGHGVEPEHWHDEGATVRPREDAPGQDAGRPIGVLLAPGEALTWAASNRRAVPVNGVEVVHFAYPTRDLVVEVHTPPRVESRVDVVGYGLTALRQDRPGGGFADVWTIPAVAARGRITVRWWPA